MRTAKACNMGSTIIVEYIGENLTKDYTGFIHLDHCTNYAEDIVRLINGACPFCGGLANEHSSIRVITGYEDNEVQSKMIPCPLPLGDEAMNKYLAENQRIQRKL